MPRKLLMPLLATLGGCFSAGAGDDDAPVDPVDPVDPEAPTFHEDVQPILVERCLGCHTAGGVAPFSLETWQDASAVGAGMKARTADRTMPPWGVDASGACGTFEDARWLEESEIDTIGAWVDAGMPEGDPTRAPAAPEADLPLDGPLVTIDMGAQYTPDEALTDDYRCFILDPGLETDQFLTAYEVRPGQPSVVHHVVLSALATPEDEAAVQALDEADPGLGYACFGAAGGESASPLAVWAPGTPVTRYPEGTGLRLLAGHKLVMQVHYNLLAGATPDRTAIDLALHAAVAHEAVISGMGDLDFRLPPDVPDAVASAEVQLVDLPILVYAHAVYPHMHLAGRTMRLEVDHEGETICMADVPRWDFHWQQYYTYTSPLVLSPNDVLRIRCTFDTTGRDTVTTFGEGTEDEMCIAALYLTW